LIYENALTFYGVNVHSCDDVYDAHLACDYALCVYVYDLDHYAHANNFHYVDAINASHANENENQIWFLSHQLRDHDHSYDAYSKVNEELSTSQYWSQGQMLP